MKNMTMLLDMWKGFSVLRDEREGFWVCLIAVDFGRFLSTLYLAQVMP